MREIRNHVKSLDHGVETRQVLEECIDAVLLGRWRDAGECTVFGSVCIERGELNGPVVRGFGTL